MSLTDAIRDAVNSSSCQPEALDISLLNEFYIGSTPSERVSLYDDSRERRVVSIRTHCNEFLEAFSYPGFKFVELFVEIEVGEVLEKLCSVLATYPFEDFSFNLWRILSTQIHGLILEALSLNKSLKGLTLYCRTQIIHDGFILEDEEVAKFWLDVDDEEKAFAVVNGQSTLRKLLRPDSALSTLRLDRWPLCDCEFALLASALASNSPPLECFEIAYDHTSAQLEGFCALLASFATNTTLHSLAISTDHILIPPVQNLQLASTDNFHGYEKLIQDNKTLTSLTVQLFSITEQQVVRIIRALEKNTTLTSFSFGKHCPGVDGKEVYEAVIDLLSINVTLKTLDLSGTPLERNPAWMSTINSMLRSSTENEELRAALGNFSRVQPSTTRVFFCGHGLAGKTTLRKTMVNLLDANLGKKVMNLFDFASISKQLGRTTGIEVTSVNHSNLEIFFWDLAGQREYHAFHDLMFPNEQGPSLFLIVCSLTHNSSPHKGSESRKPKTPDEMLGELTYWLRYISSNTKKISRRTPHVSFVFTHIDMLVGTFEIIKDQVEAHTRGLEQEFDSVAKVVGTFFVNSRKPNSVRTVVHHALNESKEIVNSCQSIHSVCNDARKMLAEWMKDHPHEPWMEVNDFIRLCRRKLPEFKVTSGFQRGKEFSDVIKAVLFSLHETGSLIYFKNLGIVLVNLQWFCNDFMGGILEKTTQLSKDLNLDEHKGVWKREEIKGILERLYNGTARRRDKYIAKRGSTSMDVKQLVNIMIQLELCFEVNSGNDLYIPATLCQREQQTHRGWTAKMGSLASNSGYVGRRLKCDDEKHTFLTPGFFPRLQVHLKNVFNTPSYELEKDLIKIVDDRLEVLIEFNEVHVSFIDIMVRFPKSKALGHDYVLDFISNKVIHSIRDLQSSTGCWQGVYLVEVALRPSCVENLIMPKIKLKQSVSPEELSSIVFKNDSVHDIENLTYVWCSLEAASLSEECTPIIELLGEKRFTGILAERLVKVEELSKQLGIHDGYSGSSSNINMGGKTPGWLARTKSVLTERDASMYGMQLQLNRMEVKMNAIAKDIKIVKDAMLEQKERLMPEVEKLLAEFRNIMSGHQHGDNAELPQFFLFNKEKTLISKLVPGMSNFKLHFMCESQPMPHLPLGQEGIEITTMDEGAMKSLLPYLQILLSTLSLAFRLGAPLAQAHGLMVPDLSSLIDSLISASCGIVDRSKVCGEYVNDEDACTNHSGNVGFDPVVMRKARIWLQEFMQKKGFDNDSEILKRFGLMKKHFRDGRRAWLCDNHFRQA